MLKLDSAVERVYKHMPYMSMCLLCVLLQADEGAVGGSSEGAGMDEDPSLTEEEDHSDSEPHSE